MAAITASEDRIPHLQTSPLKFRKILVPMDFSASAVQALETAIEVARLYNSEIVVAHASYPATYAVGEGLMTADLLVDPIKDERQKIEKILSEHPEISSLHVSTVVEYGNPVTLIRQLVEEHAPDLIVMGSHGTSRMEQIALGSVAQSLVYAVTRPVLIMGPHAVQHKQLFSRILLATDLSPESLRAAQYASSLSERFESRFVVLHVLEQDNALHGSTARRHAVLKRLQTWVPERANLLCSPEFRVEFGEPAEKILEVARSASSTLIIMAAKPASIVADHVPWAILSKVLRKSDCGVLVIRGHLA